jgi:hypothetical protein
MKRMIQRRVEHKDIISALLITMARLISAYKFRDFNFTRTITRNFKNFCFFFLLNVMFFEEETTNIWRRKSDYEITDIYAMNDVDDEKECNKHSRCTQLHNSSLFRTRFRSIVVELTFSFTNHNNKSLSVSLQFDSMSMQPQNNSKSLVSLDIIINLSFFKFFALFFSNILFISFTLYK